MSGRGKKNSSGSIDIKVVLLGASNAGKTCLNERFLYNRFSDAYSATVGAAYGTRQVYVPDSKRNYKLAIWDTAGSERYEAMTKHYYNRAAGALVCFDLTDMASFERAKYWVKQVDLAVDNCIITLVGTKQDLAPENSSSTSDANAPTSGSDYANVCRAAQQYARSIDAHFFETSAKTGAGVEAPYSDIAQRYSDKQQAGNQLPTAYDPNAVSLGQKPARFAKKNNGGARVCC
jgi:Ras-related protein Rab-24